MKPIRLLAIGHSYVVASNRVVLRELAKEGFAISVAAPAKLRGDLRALDMEPEPPGSALRLVPLTARWTGRPHLFHYAGKALDALLREPFDIVHVWEEPYQFATYQVTRRLRNSPAALSFFTFQNLVKWYPPPFAFFERAVVRRADRWSAGGELVLEAMANRGYPMNKGEVLIPAVDLDSFRPRNERERATLRSELGLPAPLVGYVGRLVPPKGIGVLLQAMEQVGFDEEWGLLCLGSGPEEPTILSWARQHGAEARVRVRLAKHGEVARYLAALDLLVVPSLTTPRWKEQFGRVIIEAFASGVPVIGSDSGEIPRVVGNAGRIVPENDPLVLAKAIGELLSDSGARERLASEGLARARRFSVPAIAQRYRSYFEAMLTRRSVHESEAKHGTANF